MTGLNFTFIRLSERDIYKGSGNNRLFVTPPITDDEVRKGDNKIFRVARDILHEEIHELGQESSLVGHFETIINELLTDTYAQLVQYIFYGVVDDLDRRVEYRVNTGYSRLVELGESIIDQGIVNLDDFATYASNQDPQSLLNSIVKYARKNEESGKQVLDLFRRHMFVMPIKSNEVGGVISRLQEEGVKYLEEVVMKATRFF